MSTARARLSRRALWLCALGALLSVVALSGHFFDIALLDTIVPGHPRMQPSTAAFMLLAAAGVALRHGVKNPQTRDVSSMMMGLIVLLFGAMVWIEYLFALNLNIDWYWSSTPSVSETPGRPSPLTASGFFAVGAALLVARVELTPKVRPSEVLFLSAIFISFVSLVGHAFGAGALYERQGSHVIGVALPTGVSLGAIGIAGLLERPRLGIMGLVTSEGPGGVLLRRLGLAAAWAGPLLGALLLALVNSIGLVDAPLILALGTVTAVSFALVLVVTTALPLERAHETEAANRARIYELLELAPEGIFVADLEGRYTEVNAAGCRLLGYSRTELVGKTIVDLLRPEDVDQLWKSQEAQLRGEVEVGEWELRRKDGTYVPVEVTAKILPGGRWQGFVRDISQRLELERKLLESRDFLQTVLESSTEYGIIAEDLERRVVLWNEGAKRSYGFEREEIVGKPSEVLVPEDARDCWDALHARGIEQGSAEGSVTGRRRDGSHFSARIVCTRRVGPDKRIAGALIVTHDLTAEQRHLADQEFLSRVGVELASCLDYGETLARVLELAVSFLGDIASLDVLKDGVLERARVLHRSAAASPIAEAVLQLGAARAAGHPLWTVLENKQPLLLSDISEEERRRFGTTPEHARVLDEVKASSAMLVPLIARGQLLAVLSIAACEGSRRYEVADLRLAEELARRAALSLDNVQLFQQSRLQGAMTTKLAEGVVLIRAADGLIVYANPRFEAMFGYEPGELLGKPVHVLNAPNQIHAEERARRIIEALDRTAGWHGEIENIRKDGSRLWCAASVSTFQHEQHGKVWIAVHSDITERKRLEEKNARSLREKEVLLKEIHHRVKNNLQVISSLFSLQRERTQSEELRSLLDESRIRVQSIALVHEQLYGSAELAVIDLDSYLRSLVQSIGASYGAAHVRLEASAAGVVLDVQEAVPCALIVCELVSNSLKHAFDGHEGKVWVHARRDAQGCCVLEVRDNGRGLPVDLDWKKTRSLGLRLVHSLTHQLRGSVELDRSQGTCFRIRFALKPFVQLPSPKDHTASQMG